jgi:TolA-binding protein
MVTLKSKMLAWVSLCVLAAGCATNQYYINDAYDNAEKAYDKGRYTEAADHYQKFITENPDSNLTDVAYYYLAESYQKAGDDAKAKKVFQQLIDKYENGFWVDSAKRKLKEM